MVIKVHLIKPKNKYTPTFYKTSQIKFQSLSIQQQPRFRTRSTPKIIRSNNPWQLMSNQEINSLAQRLQDKPQELYQIVKQNQRQKSQQLNDISKKLKFNRLKFTSPQQHTKSTINLSNSKYFNNKNKNNYKKPYLKLNNINKNNNNPNKLPKYFSQSSLSINPNDDHNSILSKINIKKLQYEKQMNQIIRNKRLILETDLPKISKIKIIDSPKMNINNRLKLSNDSIENSSNFNIYKSGKLPVWRMR